MAILMNGKKVNHLIVSGVCFTSEEAFPAYYAFPNATSSQSSPVYGCLFHDTKREFSELRNASGTIYATLINNEKVLVDRVLEVDGKKYLYIYAQYNESGGDGVKLFNSLVWVDENAFGGGQRIETTK